MYVIKRFSELSYNQSISLWNEAWKHYFSDMTMDLNRFLQKLTGEGISLENSVVAFYEDKPVGFILNSFRTIDGKKNVWNGGTAITPEFRGMGVGKKLMDACFDIYKEHDVDAAWLEAIKENDPAIGLYKKMGYEVFEELTFLQYQGPVNGFNEQTILDVEDVTMHTITMLPFYNPHTAWQTQFASLKDFNCAVVKAEDGSPAGYAVYKKAYNEKGEIVALVLYQFLVDSAYQDEVAATASLLNHVFGPWELNCRRLTMNIPKRDDALNRLLTNAGFTPLVEQVHMAKPMQNATETEAATKTFSEVE